MVHSELIYKSFYNVIKPVTGFKVVQAFIDDFITLPNQKFQNQIVVTPPTLPLKNYSFEDTEYSANSEILIEIYASTMKDATIAYDTVCNKILANKNNLIVGNIKFGTSQPGSVVEGGTKIHIIPIIISFDYNVKIDIET